MTDPHDPSKKLTIVIAEDQLMIRDVVRNACNNLKGVTIVGETDSGTKAVALILKLKPQAVILDLSLPGLDGFTVIEKIRKKLPHVRILIMSGHCDNLTVCRVEEIEAHGFIDKNTHTVEVLKDALQALFDRKTYFSETYQRARKELHADPNSFMKLLSDWERSILSMIGHGMDNDQIASHLKMAPRTAKTHRTKIMKKLGVHSTPELMAYARENGFTRIRAKDYISALA